MSDLATLVEPLKREIAIPGEFDTTFPNTSDDDLTYSLADGFAEAQLDGYFPTLVLDPDDNSVTPDLSAAGGSLVIIYTGMRIIRSQLRALNTRSNYEAASVKYEVEKSSTVLREELKYLIKRRDDLTAQARRSTGATYVFDSYFARSAVDWSRVGGFYAYELV